MLLKIKSILLLSIVLLFVNIATAQDIKNVDVKTVPQSDIKKAQQAMKDAGLSTQDAANIARQKGATEQQIRDFENRINDGSNQSGQQFTVFPC